MSNNIYRFVNTLLLTFSCLWCLGNYLGIDEVDAVSVCVGCLVAAGLAVWCQMGVKGRVLLLGAVVAAFVFTNLVLGTEEAGVYWGNERERIQTAVITLVCFGICLLAEHLFLVKVVVVCVLVGVLGYDLFTDRNLPHMGVVFAILYMAIVYVEWTQQSWKKVRLASNKHYMMQIMPFLILYLGCMSVMPAPEKPYDWQFVKDVYADVKEAFLQVSRNWINGDREDFSFGTSGFSGDGRLLGGITDKNKTLMIIQGQANLKTNVYLVGKVYDTFDGDGWTSTDTNEVNDRQLDALETLCAVRAYEAEGEAKYLERTRIKIWYEDFRTNYLFAPLKTTKVQNVEEPEFVCVGGNYIFHDKQGYGREYNTSFLQLNVDHPLFYDFLEKDNNIDEELFEQVQKETYKTAKYSLTDLVNRKTHIFDTYGEVPELSLKAQNWVLEVTEGAQTDIDKLKAIEAALQQMTYTKTPGELPEWVDSESDFLDYFLMDSRRGYCVYYASAFVLLARAEGFPVRYVEGFCVPVTGTQKVLITSDMAHAWPEVYIENVGWIPFEPTPGYSEIRYTPWEISSKEIGDGTANIGASVTQEDATEDIVEDEEKMQESVEDTEEKSDAGNLLKIIGATLLLVVAGGVLILAADIMLRRSRMRRYNLEERFLAQIAMNMRLLAALGYERQENETLQELRIRAWAIMESEEIDEKPEFLFLKFYEEYLYGQYPVREEMLDVLALEKGCLLQMLKKWKPLLYLYYHIF